MFVLISCVTLQSAWIFTDYKNSNNEFVIFHKSRKTLIAQKNFQQQETMALAGTTTVESYEKNPKLFEADEKQRSEHKKVIEDMFGI